MFLKLPFAVSLSVLFITIQYAVFSKSFRTFYVSLCISDLCIYIYMIVGCVALVINKSTTKENNIRRST